MTTKVVPLQIFFNVIIALMLASVVSCKSKIQPSLTDAAKSSSPDPSSFTQNQNRPDMGLPASTEGIIVLTSAPPVIDGKVQLDSHLISGSNLVFRSKISNKEATSTSISITEVDSTNHRACFHGDLSAFSICPAAPVVVAINANGEWSFELPKNIFIDGAEYQVELSVNDQAQQSIASSTYDFHWKADLQPIASPSELASVSPLPSEISSASPSPSASPSDSSGPSQVPTNATIISVSSANHSGSYKLGDLIDIAVTFSEPVVVTGSPTLMLGSQGTAVATYVMGSGSRILTFAYTVGASDLTGDLEYSSDHALVLGTGDSITALAGANSNVTLTLPPLGGSQSLGGGTAISIDGVAPHIVAVSHLTTIANGTIFKTGDFIDLTVSFSEPINATGTPQIDLATSGTSAVAIYAPSVTPPNSSTLIFRYVIGAGQSANDLDYLNTTALTLGSGGSIRDSAGNSATLTLPVPGATGSLSPSENIVIDSITPTVTQVSAADADGAYHASQSLAIQVQFSEVVVVTGSPQLTLETGSDDNVATYTSGSGTATLVFSYVVQVGDVSGDLDYVSISALALNSGTIKDTAGNNAILTLSSPGASGSLAAAKALIIDSVVPTILSVQSSTSDGSYKTGDSIFVTISFSKAVTVTGTPELILETGANDAIASYTSGSPGTILTFRYDVSANEASNHLDYQNASALSINSGSIIDGSGNHADLTLPPPASTGSLSASANLVVDTSAPTVSQVTSPNANGTFALGQSLSIQTIFSEAVIVTGTPQLTLETGATNYVANYSGGTGTNTITFAYTVQSGDTAADLDYISNSALTLNSGTIKDSAGNAAILTLATPGTTGSLGTSKDFVVSSDLAAVTSVSSAAGNGTYKAGGNIAIILTFSKSVTVVGTPQLTLETGSTDATASYISGSPGTVLTFQYTVGAGENSSDLEYANTTALSLNGGTIRDASTNNAILTLPIIGSASLSANKDIVIDTTSPSVSQVTASNANGTFSPAQTVTVQVVFTEIVIVTGIPQLTLETGATDAVVSYSSGSNSTTLSFIYTVQAGDTAADLDYTTTSALALNGGTIKDTIGNDATLTLATPGQSNSLGATKNIVISSAADVTAPTVSSVTSSTADGTYITGATIDILVNFSEIVFVTGTPTIQLETGSIDQTLNYVSGSGSTTLRFDYVVQSPNTSADLNYKAASSLVLNGGTIKDGAGNNATLTLPALAAAQSLAGGKAIVVDGTIPTINNMTSNKANGTYGLGVVIDIRLVFSEIVNVTGTPTVQLETGTVDEVVNYSSGSGTTTLIFNYTVQAEDYSTDLNYVSTASLSAAGGTIKDVNGNDANLGLPTIVSNAFLARNKDIKINAITIGPGAFSISSIQSANNSLVVSWSTPTGQGIAYTVKYSLTSGSYTKTASSTATSPYTINYLSNGDTAYVMVTAINNGGTVNASSEQSGTPAAFWVSAGRNRVEKASATITGQSLNAASLAWSTTSGPGTITYGTPSAVATTVSASVDGTYVLRLTGTDAGSNQVYDEMTLVWDTTSPSFSSLNLTSIASDGTLNRVEARAPTNLVTALSASNYQTMQYLLTENSFNCNAYTDSYYNYAVPAGYDTYFYPANDYKVCIKLGRFNGNVVYGETSAFTRETSLPANDPHTVKSMAVGQDFVCSILNDDTVRCWGVNDYGQLGYNDKVTRGDNQGEFAALTAVNLGTGRTAKKIVSGLVHACSILDDDTVKCWGAGTYIGVGDANSRGDGAGEMAALPIVNLGSGRTAKDIAASQTHTCVILDNDSVKCWGTGTAGALGYDDATSRGTTAASMTNLPAVDLGTNRSAKTIATGTSFSCAILDTDELKCWGSNSSGGLGLGDLANRGAAAGSMAALPTVNLGTNRTAKAVSLGTGLACAILDTDDVKCWGENGSGQLGLESFGDMGDASGEMAALPIVNLGAGRTAKTLGVAEDHICVVMDNNLVKCWGVASEGQLGIATLKSTGGLSGDMTNLPTVNLGTGRTAKGISTLINTTCVVLDTDAAKCWGQNLTGTLGNDSARAQGGAASDMKSTPAVFLGTGRTAKKVSPGGEFTCALLDTDEVKCWGRNFNGSLGYGDTTMRGAATGDMAALDVVDFGGGHKVKDISAGHYHACAILDNDSLKCWGYNIEGALGQDTVSSKGATPGQLAAMTPVNLGVNRTAKKVAAGYDVTCVLLDNNQLKCFGDGSHYILAKGNSTNIGVSSGDMAALTPIGLGTGRTVSDFTLALHHVCALLDDSSVKCWGSNTSGALGYDDLASRGDNLTQMAMLPVLNFGPGRHAQKIAGGSMTTCALLDDNTVKCWGAGSSGQLGSDYFASIGNSAGDMASLTAINLGTSRTAINLAIGSSTSCAFLDDSSFKCWGSGSYGASGYDDRSPRGKTTGSMATIIPVNFGAGRTVIQYATYSKTTCAILDDQTLHCWGDNTYGNLGYDDMLARGGAIPVNQAPELYFP